MKTSELYIEQILIGALIILIAMLPWLPELLEIDLKDVSTVSGLVSGSLLLGVAFWLGIPFDRFSDTLLERLDRHNRLHFILKNARGTVSSTEGFVPYEPLFAEDKARIGGLREGGSVADWISYHASRIRLTRAFAVFGPALTLTLTVGLVRWREPALVPGGELLWATALSLLAVYAAWAFAAPADKKSLPREGSEHFLAYAKPWFESGTIGRKERSNLHAWALEWKLLLAPAVLILAALMLAVCSGRAEVVAAALGAVLLTYLAAWSWWRIMTVYRGYLSAFQRFPAPP